MAHLGNTIVNGALRVLGGENVDTINGATVGTSPKFTDASVTQTATTTNANYEVLFSATADNTTRTEGARKTTTLRFNPSTGSLMEGSSTVASGTNSHAEGSSTTANGTSCHAEGGNTRSLGDYSHSEGYMTSAINGSHAEGNRTIASRQDSHSEGYKTEAKGSRSHAEGDSTSALGSNSHAEGYNTLVIKELYDSMYGSHAEGYQTTCGNDGSGKHAEGFKTSAYGTGSHSEGVSTVANGNQGAHAEGDSTVASGLASHAEGNKTTASGKSSHAEGYLTWTSPTAHGAHAEGGYPASGDDGGTTANGLNAHAEGFKTVANGASAHAEGNYTTASSSGHAEGRYTQAGTAAHAEGRQTTASSEYSHAEGYITLASGNFTSHAEGYVTSAFGNYGSHSEGYKTRASGTASHAEGDSTTASGNYSHASGQGTSAGGVCQTVIGKYNVADTSSAFIIGNGTANDARSNAFKVDFTGNINTKGCLAINSTTGDYTEGLRINLASNGYSTLTIGTANGSGNNISDGAYWIGTYTGSRKLYIAHNCSTQTATYFGADSSGAQSPYLNLGSSGTVESGNTRAVTGGAVYSFMQPGVKTFQVERGASFSSSRQGYWAGMLRTDQAGSPTLPIANKWFHVLSMDWGNDSANWVSQLAIGTQDDSNSGVWWRCNNAGGTDISSSTWKHLVEDTQAPPQHSFDFTLTSDNNNKWYKVLSRGNGVPSTSSFKGIITISVAHYGYTNGTTKSFMVQSSYQSMTLYPFDSIGDEVGWLPTWRVSVDSTNMYVEFYVSGITSPAQNPFRITYTSLSNTHSGDPITFYDTLTASTATAVVQQYTIKAAFRTLTASEALEAGSATWTRTASTAGSVTLRRYGKVKELVIWGTALPAVSGAAVSTLQLSDPSYYPLHNNVQFTGSDDNSQIVIGYITTGGIVYLANRSTSPIYCNVTYM